MKVCAKPQNIKKIGILLQADVHGLALNPSIYNYTFKLWKAFNLSWVWRICICRCFSLLHICKQELKTCFLKMRETQISLWSATVCLPLQAAPSASVINAAAYLPSLGSGVPFLMLYPAAPAAGTERTRDGLFLLLKQNPPPTHPPTPSTDSGNPPPTQEPLNKQTKNYQYHGGGGFWSKYV